MKMKVAFRVDASLQIGSGHVMRCLTLAESLVTQGVECVFISRSHAGNLHALIRQRGYALLALPDSTLDSEDTGGIEPVHASWLGCNWRTDAEQTASAIGGNKVDWLIVDHYALDERWETSLRSACNKLMVIDDLADRAHQCDLLLDQNLGRSTSDYAGRVPPACQLLTGTQYALLRPQFSAFRDYSLKRRHPPELKNILVTMGGVDLNNATQQFLAALRNCTLPQDCMVTVVMGPQAPWLEQVTDFAATMPFPTEVLVNVSDMAGRMADSDLAIGAAGSTAWERCCLGLPSLMVVLADNQRSAAMELERLGAARRVELDDHLQNQLGDFVSLFAVDAQTLLSMIDRAAEVVDGKGVERVLSHMLNLD